MYASLYIHDAQQFVRKNKKKKDMPEASNIIDPINQTTKLKEQDFDTDDNLEPSTDSNKKDWKIFTNCLQYIKNGLYNGIQTTKHSFSNVALYTLQLLKNPMILMNCVVGIGFISVIFLGYIKYEKRFLMGKSNSFIWSCLFGSTCFVTFDYYLFNKYYLKKLK